MKLELSSSLPACSTIQGELGRLSQRINGIRVHESGAVVSFRMKDLSKPVLLHYDAKTSNCSAYVGRTRIRELPYTCERRDLWETLYKYSAQGIGSDNIRPVESYQQGRIMAGIFADDNIPEFGDEIRVRVQIENEKEVFWITANSYHDAMALLGNVFDSRSPRKLLENLTNFGWESPS